MKRSEHAIKLKTNRSRVNDRDGFPLCLDRLD